MIKHMSHISKRGKRGGGLGQESFLAFLLSIADCVIITQFSKSGQMWCVANNAMATP